MEELDKEVFMEKYHLWDVYDKSKLSWDNLTEIYCDYVENHYPGFQNLSQKLVLDFEDARRKRKNDNKLAENMFGKVHTVFARPKDPEHLIEKIIRKVGTEDSAAYSEICKDNYRDIITDLIGARVLVLAKEDWKIADDLIRSMFCKFKENPPKAYICYGDREIFDRTLMDVQYTNKGYRSQHYIVSYGGCYTEIQVRTLAEEVHGEFDHRTRYPYKVNNKFLTRYSKIVSKCITELDDLISTCLEMDDDILDGLNKHFEADRYVDWSKKILSDRVDENVEKKSIPDCDNGYEARSWAENVLYRKGV